MLEREQKVNPCSTALTKNNFYNLRVLAIYFDYMTDQMKMLCPHVPLGKARVVKYY